MAYAFLDKISYHLPETSLSNEELWNDFSESLPNSGLKKLGIKSRRIVAPNELASDLGVKAAERLFEEHNVAPESIDFLVFCAQEFDYFTPSTACVMHQRLGLKSAAGALDYNLGCSGYIYGLSIANGLICTGAAERVLLVTSSTLTRELHPQDKASRVIFGDGAAATLVSKSEREQMHQSCFGTDGTGYDVIIKKDGGARNPLNESSSEEVVDSYHNVSAARYLKMDGTAVLLFALERVPPLISDTLAKNNLTIADIDLFILHQANHFLLDSLRKKLRIPEEKFYFHLESVGNTVSSSIPIALREAMNEGKAQPGMKVMLVAFGVGLSWGATIVTL